jgi:hypothetical protein
MRKPSAKKSEGNPGRNREVDWPYGVGAGQGVLGLDVNGQQAWTTLSLSIVAAASWPVSWLALVSPSVPTQYPQTNTVLAAFADSGTTVPCGTVSVCVASVDAAAPLTETEHQER